MIRRGTGWMGLAPLSALWLLCCGCDRPRAQTQERTPPNPNAPAAYGPPAGPAPRAITRVGSAPPQAQNWTNAGLAVLQTELSPAVLVRASSRHLDLFAGTTNAGLAAPSFITWTTMNGPRTFKRDEELDLEKTKLEECWLLVWWAGAAGWTNWDAPWVVYLQHKPRQIKLDADGLHLDFPRAAGEVVLLPLYGYEKLPQRGHDLLAEHGMTGRKVKTWDWPEVLKRDPLTRIRYWAAVTRELPIRCEESFRVDRGADTVTFRSRFEWHRIEDDWKTPHLKLAPVSPTLALAVKHGFPARFSKSWFDLDYFTPYGPYLAVEGVDQFEVALPVLQYVHETENVDPAGPNVTGVVLEAAGLLQKVMAAQFSGGGQFQYGVDSQRSLEALTAVAYYARALPYCDPLLRSNATIALGRHFREHLLRTNQSDAVAPAVDSGQGYRGSPRQERGANALLLQGLWAYAHFCGDWGLPRERWPLVKSLFVTGATTRWAGFGASGAAANADAAGACIAFARLAYRVGDLEAYEEACARLACELALLVVKQRGSDYFRKQQPYHSLEFMDEEVFLTGTEDGVGWVLDGPQFPASVSLNDRRYLDRWNRFLDLDVARFYREYLGEDVRQELGWLQDRADSRRLGLHGGEEPSFVYLRSLLLNEEPAALAALAAPSQFRGPRAGIVANGLAFVRAHAPTRYQRLIPPGGGETWASGPEREMGRMNAGLGGSLETGLATGARGAVSAWPAVAWPRWRAAGGRSWSFGEIRGQGAPPASGPQRVALNQNTSLVVYESERGR